MNGNYSNYPNVAPNPTSVWVSPNATDLAMQPLVDQFGNLRINNQIIPLTTPVMPLIGQSPSMPNLVSPSLSPLTSPLTSQGQPNGSLFVGSPPGNVVTTSYPNVNLQSPVRESPYNTVTPISSYELKAQNQLRVSPYSTVTPIQNGNDWNSVSAVRETPYGRVAPLQVRDSPYTTVASVQNNFDLKAQNQIRESPYSQVNPVQASFRIENGNGLEHMRQQIPVASPPINSLGVNGVMTNGQQHQQMVNGSPRRQAQRVVSNPVQPQAQPPPMRHRRVSAPDPHPIPFKGQPYMRQLAIDHSNGEFIQPQEQDVTPITSPRYMTQVPVGDYTPVERPSGGSKLIFSSATSSVDGTDTSSMSSTSISPYSSMPSSPRPDPQGSSTALSLTEDKQIVYDPVPPRYAKPSESNRCLMCNKIVYAMEKRGPIKGVLFHKGCFKCAVCNMTLDLKNFCQNDNDLADLNVYCKTHKPAERFGKLDAGALSINRALQAPRLTSVNEQIRGGPDAMRGGRFDTNALNIKSALNAPKPDFSAGENVRRTSHNYNIDGESVSMVHARSVPATELQSSNKLHSQVWSRDERRAEGVPPPDVIRYDTEVHGYGGEPYTHDPPPENTYR